MSARLGIVFVAFVTGVCGYLLLWSAFGWKVALGTALVVYSHHIENQVLGRS